MSRWSQGLNRKAPSVAAVEGGEKVVFDGEIDMCILYCQFLPKGALPESLLYEAVASAFATAAEATVAGGEGFRYRIRHCCRARPCTL
jgi:hypothetical protein